MSRTTLPFAAAAAAARGAGFKDLAAVMEGIAEWAASPSTHVVVCGEFKRGKSTLINCLVGQRVCPEDRLPATAVPMVLTAGSPAAAVVTVQGAVERIEPTLEAFSALTVSSGNETGHIRFVRVSLPSPLLEAGIVLIDTPGVNDLSQQRTDVTYQYLPFADAAVVVLDATAPVTASETRFLKEAVFEQVSDRIVFALGKCDRLDEDELEEAIHGARERLQALGIADPTLLPISTRRGPAGVAPLREALSAASARTGRDRQLEAARRLHRQLSTLLDEVVAAKAMAAAAFDREAALGELRAVSATMGQRYQAVRTYADTFGRDTLHQLVEASLQKLQQDLIDEVRHDVSTASGDLDRYKTVHLPRKIELRLKGWVERKSPELAGFLRSFIARVAADFEKAFVVPLETTGLPAGFELPRYEIARGQATKTRTEAFLAEHMLPNALAMGAGALLFGPVGLTVGIMAGQVAGVVLRERKLEAQRAELLAAVPSLVEAVIGGFQAGLTTELDAWFDRLHEHMMRSLGDARGRAETRLLTSEKTATHAAQERDIRALLTELENQWLTS